RIFQNVTSLEFSGIEIEWQQIVLPRLVFEGSISVQQNENESGVKDLQLVPNEMAKFGVRYTSLTGASIGIFDVYTNAPTAREKLFPTTLIVNSEPKAIHDLSISVKMPIKHAALSSAKAESFLQFNAENILESEAITFPDLV
ncbi:MAG TPA: hypothetical protein DCZ03_13810, partial [Gammaproteobacteria bacterium]|nr:hypothetical protein [Gammaproteobacteria bacterium]